MVDDTIIAGVKMSTEDIMRRLKGPKGSEVNLKIVRRGVGELLPFTVKGINSGLQPRCFLSVER